MELERDLEGELLRRLCGYDSDFKGDGQHC